MFSKRNVILTSMVVGAAALLVVTQSAWSNHHYRLGGAWVGSVPGAESWVVTQSPMDPEGQTANVQIQWIASEAFAGVLESLGADSFSLAVGEHEMINRDTSKYTVMWFALKQGNPSEIKGTFVLSGKWHYVNQDNVISHETLAFYNPAKTDPVTGLPLPNVAPDFAMPSGPTAHHRVPILPQVAIPVGN
jgi:hypothetical protein